MKTYSFTPEGVCAKQITFAIDEKGRLHDVRFIGGCPGNLSAISKLLEGADPKNVAVLLKGNDCGGRGTSCADQLAIALNDATKMPEIPGSSLPVKPFIISWLTISCSDRLIATYCLPTLAFHAAESSGCAFARIAVGIVRP